MILLPDDPHDRRLAAHVRPESWSTPVPAERYNLVVIGGGPAGLVAALGARGLGARVALIEKGLLGGDCLVAGCVPSKALLRAAHAAQATRELGELGLTGTVRVDFPAVMERMRRIRADIGPHDSAARLKGEGIDVFLGEARFTGADSLQVGETTLRFARCCIATGARPARPPIPGLDHTDVLTNETLFTLTEQPSRLAVVGAGVIGTEMAQAFARLGSRVTLIDRGPRPLPREEEDASARVAERLERDGVELRLGVHVERFEPGPPKRVVLEGGDAVEADAVLLAVGRRPNVELDLERAGVRYDRGGIAVDDFLVTSNPRIYAAGDVLGGAQFTHVADHHARIVVRNALFFGRARASKLVVPRVTYTHPEVAAVGVSAAEARDRGLRSFTVQLADTDRGRTDSAEGFCTVHVDRRGQVFGATVVADDAGELLAPVTLAMTHGLGLSAFASTLHPYPTRSEVLFKVASAWNRTRLSPWMKRVAESVLAWRRR